MLFEAHLMDALVNVHGVFSDHYLIDGRMVLLPTLVCGSHSATPRLESWKPFINVVFIELIILFVLP